MWIQRLVFPAPHRCTVETAELPDAPAPGEVLVRNRVSVISAGTELAMFTRIHRGCDEPDFAWAKYPFYPGYAAVGEVVAVGANVADVIPGELVFHQGRHATHAMLPLDRAHRVLSGVSAERAAFFAMLQIAMTAPRTAPVRFGENELVMGAGVVGNLCAQLCKLAGAGRVAVADLAPARLALAAKCGIDEQFDLSVKPLREWLSAFGPAGAELVIEAVGLADTIQLCLNAVARKGRVVLLGSPRVRMEWDPYFQVHTTGVHISGAHASTVDPATRKRDEPFLWSLLASGRVRVDPLITHRLPFTQAPSAYEGLRDRKDEYVGVVLEYQ